MVSAQLDFDYDNTQPGVTLAVTIAVPTREGTIPLSVTFGKEVREQGAFEGEQSE